jgi:hypothetical protein
MNLKEALKLGYTLGDCKLQQGYVSRKINTVDQEVMFAQRDSDGRPCAGRPYVLLSNPNSTRYCYRQYLNFPETKKAEVK